jgi:hypothetical protein
MTGAANAPPPVGAVRVLIVERMPVDAMRLVGEPLGCVSAPDVLLLRDRLEVRRIDATRVLAQMVDYVPVGDGAYKKFVRDPMRTRRRLTAHAEGAVAFAVTSPEPLPAVVRLVDALPEDAFPFGPHGVQTRHASLGSR